MKEVYSSYSPSDVAFRQSVLEHAGIPYLVRNDLTQNLIIGADFWAELCVVEDEDYDEAKRLLAEAQEEPPSADLEWTCPACGEKVPGNFTSCWKCRTERDAKVV